MELEGFGTLVVLVDAVLRSLEAWLEEVINHDLQQ